VNDISKINDESNISRNNIDEYSKFDNELLEKSEYNDNDNSLREDSKSSYVQDQTNPDIFGSLLMQ
jgi:hypothetical protein